VVKGLQKQFGDMYHFDNVVISGTHTHGTPGGFLMYLLYDLTVLGFVAETFNAQVAGITRVSITLYHDVFVQTEIILSNSCLIFRVLSELTTTYETPVSFYQKQKFKMPILIVVHRLTTTIQKRKKPNTQTMLINGWSNFG
jgi:hypothetical protein